MFFCSLCSCFPHFIYPHFFFPLYLRFLHLLSCHLPFLRSHPSFLQLYISFSSIFSFSLPSIILSLSPALFFFPSPAPSLRFLSFRLRLTFFTPLFHFRLFRFHFSHHFPLSSFVLVSSLPSFSLFQFRLFPIPSLVCALFHLRLTPSSIYALPLFRLGLSLSPLPSWRLSQQPPGSRSPHYFTKRNRPKWLQTDFQLPRQPRSHLSGNPCSVCSNLFYSPHIPADLGGA